MAVTRFKRDVMNMGGGIVQGIPPTHIRDHEFEVYNNFYPFGTRARRRPGTARLTHTPYFEQVTAMGVLRPNGSGIYSLIVGGLTSIGIVSGVPGFAGKVTQLANLAGYPYNANTFPWIFRQYKGILYGARRATGTLKRITNQTYGDAGIPAPVIAPVLSDGGSGGALAAGDFVGVFTYFNRQTFAESNPSPPSNVLTLASGHSVIWGPLAPSTSDQATSVRLYRSLPNQTGSYYFVKEVDTNGTLGNTNDNADVNHMGAPVTFNNGVPPSSIVCFDIWKERGWTSDGISVFFSELGLIESFGGSSVINVYPDDGSQVRALHGHGDRFIIGKNNAIHFLTGTDASDFQVQTLSDRHGCVAHHSMKSAEGYLLWFGGDDFYRSDMNGVTGIGTVKIRKILDSINPTYFERAVSYVYPRLGWYVTAIPTNASATNNLVVVYNYQTDVWSTFTYPAPGAPSFMNEAFDANFEFVVYAAMGDGHVYQLLSGNDDYGNRIAASLQSKSFSSSEEFNPYYPVTQKDNAFARVNRNFGILSPVQGDPALTLPNVDVTISVIRDQGFNPSAAKISRVVDLASQSRPWKNYTLKAEDQLASSIAFGIDYSGLPPIDIDAFYFEGDLYEGTPGQPGGETTTP